MKWDAAQYDSVKAPQVDAGKELIAMAKVKNSDSVLDIGCGTGKLTLELSRLASKGTVVGIDPSEEMLEKAEEMSGARDNIRFMLIPGQSMQFTDQFDLVFSNSALQWIREQQKVVRLAYRSLKKGGRIAFQLPAKNFCLEFFAYTSAAITLLGYEKYFKKWQTPWYLPTKEEYETALKEAGFKKINVFSRDYRLLFGSVGEVIAWWSSAGLRPFLELLSVREQAYFKYAVAMSYETNRTARGIEFGFRRLFAFAEKI
jgi:trans-aconitate 2-methyltransferase